VRVAAIVYTTMGEARCLMKLERYNQIAFALLATAAFLGAAVMGASIVWPRSDGRGPGVIVDPAARTEDTPPQNLVFCPPIVEPTGAHEYVAVGAVVATDASLDPVLSASQARSRYDGNSFGSCDIGGYGGATRVFNVVVRDRATNEQHLLLAEPGLVVSVEVPAADCAAGEGPAPCGTLLWRLRPADTNGDGTINHLDAIVAYASALGALALEPLTPPDATLLASQWSAASARWYFQVRRDANQDGRYSNEDGAEVLETDTTAPAMGRLLVDPQIAASLLATVR
jgi:hypothetical protein